jgi:hypothetical protein
VTEPFQPAAQADHCPRRAAFVGGVQVEDIHEPGFTASR